MTERTKLVDISAFPIERAWFCAHCETVANKVECPYCLGNGHPLASWINRPATLNEQLKASLELLETKTPESTIRPTPTR